MALINCTECGCELSEYADKCPKCGCPTTIILENIRNNQVKKIPQPDNNINELKATKASPVLGDFMKKKERGNLYICFSAKQMDNYFRGARDMYNLTNYIKQETVNC